VKRSHFKNIPLALALILSAVWSYSWFRSKTSYCLWCSHNSFAMQQAIAHLLGGYAGSLNSVKLPDDITYYPQKSSTRISRFPIRNLPPGIAHRLYWRVVNEWNIVRFSRFSCDYWFLLNHRGCIEWH
jgi:hypothetical protein